MKTSGAEAPEFFLNNRRVFLRDVGVQTTLLDYIRAQGLTGAKEGCAEGECGACTVILVAGREAEAGCEYRAVNSCLMLAPMAAGQEIFTVEALAADGKLLEVQEAMAKAGGSQCGYCTPGFVMSLFAEHYRPGRVGACDPEALGGNLCRCTGYRPIRDAALSLGAPPPGAFLDRLSRAAPALEAVDYQDSAARFSRPATLEHCLAILAEDAEARVIAGGTDLVVESNLRARRWRHLVSVEAVAELREFYENENAISIGAGLPLNAIAKRWQGAPGVVREWLRLFASPPLRNRATLGGNLATASPIGDGAPLLLALDARVHLARRRARRVVPLHSFFTGYRRTLLEPGELIVSVEIPKPLPDFVRFYKVAKRRTDDISTVTAAMALSWDTGGRVAHARLAFGGVGPIPMRVIPAEDAIGGQRWNDAAVQRAQAAVQAFLKPIGDHRGSAEYRLAVSQSLLAKFLWERRRETA
jgi:xanthine dehydrogenase small subunit